MTEAWGYMTEGPNHELHDCVWHQQKDEVHCDPSKQTSKPRFIKATKAKELWL